LGKRFNSFNKEIHPLRTSLMDVSVCGFCQQHRAGAEKIH
jgi:hypothetical protein